MNSSFLSQALLKHYGVSALTIKQLVGESDLNYYVKSKTRQSYILKIAAKDERIESLELQNAAMLHVAQKSLDFELPNVILNLKGEYITIIQDEDGDNRMVRLISWIDGKLFHDVNPHSSTLLQDLGKRLAEMGQALQDFNHPNAAFDFKWDNAQGDWVEEHLNNFGNVEKNELINFAYAQFQNAKALFPQLPQAIIHNDANDYNIIVSNDKGAPKINGFIDFGDLIYTHRINDLAISAAYIGMNKVNPLESILDLVQGFHEASPLSEIEVESLFGLICTRLMISLTASHLNSVAEPENEYLLVSAKPGWNLLKQLCEINPRFATYRMRAACGMEPCAKALAFRDWMARQPVLAKIIEADLNETDYKVMDLGVGSMELGHNSNFENLANFSKWVNRTLEDNEVEIGLGGYGEVRPVYTTDAYKVMSNDGPEWRTVHLGLDIWKLAGTAIFAPIAGKLVDFKNNDQDRDYGGTIILEHKVSEELTFWTLYGHLSLKSLEGLALGQEIAQGEQFAWFGNEKENGGWPPHLHFQVMLDRLDIKGDFPGVCFYNEAAVWKSICPNPELLIFGKEKTSHTTGKSIDEILSNRKKSLGRNYSISYQEPLKMVRAHGQYLYDYTGRRYLDTVNNVPHVGHQNERVVKAATQQIHVLNTNTRYLHENITNYAEALLKTLPEQLSVYHFTNSGSEANELAIRMAKAFTGQKDMIVVEVGYHGNTNACIEISSYKFDGKGGQGAPAHIQVVPIPDTYRGIEKDNENPGEAYAAYVQKAIDEVQAKGKGIAGFISESILSCGGQVVLPAGYLKNAFAAVRAAGGVCIVDEVQVGFGRVGDAFWGFELQEVVPDIVVMGKPIANGHPMGAVICTAEIAEAFANGMEYFNTFGGNPVSCAIAHEVLNVVQEEQLQSHAQSIGNYIKDKLKELKTKYSIIGDVRGHGLFLGIELVNNHKPLEPAAQEATYLINRMRDKGVLMSTDGPLHNVIKIKPPMCFNLANADFLVKMLEEVLIEIG